MTESYEELALHEGAITVSTLALGPYGEFLIVNRMDPRLTSPPPVQPPPLVRLHFSRLLGPRSLSRRLSAPRMATSDDAGAARSAPVSVVQALVAWLADDWRSLLAGLPVELVGHRGSADCDGMAWPPGPRWQSLREDAPVLPTSMVDRLLRRAGWLDLDPKGFTLAGAGDWWCLVTAKDDLDHFGLDAVRAPPTATLPLQVAMLVIVDADEQQGQVLHLRDGGSTPAAGIWRSPARDPSYLALRMHCLDAVLQTLERRL